MTPTLEKSARERVEKREKDRMRVSGACACVLWCSVCLRLWWCENRGKCKAMISLSLYFSVHLSSCSLTCHSLLIVHTYEHKKREEVVLFDCLFAGSDVV